MKLSKDEIGLAYALVAALNGIQPLSKEHRSLDETAFGFLFFDSGDRFSCCDCYGNPTLIRIIADRIAAGGFTQAAEAAEASRAVNAANANTALASTEGAISTSAIDTQRGQCSDHNSTLGSL